MSKELFPYDQWVNEALLSVLSRALKQLSERGPIGDHHFFINFDTSYEGVDIPDFLRAQYPEEITIVLQHQFDDLIIGEHGLEVSLSFNGKKSHLKVPFAAVTSFADPSVNFGLKIGVNAVGDTLTDVHAESDFDNAGTAEILEIGESVEQALLVQAEVQKVNSDIDNAAAGPEISSNEEDDSEPQTAEVITLDAFRKK
jgi:hypothetical protein